MKSKGRRFSVVMILFVGALLLVLPAIVGAVTVVVGTWTKTTGTFYIAGATGAQANTGSKTHYNNATMRYQPLSAGYMKSLVSACISRSISASGKPGATLTTVTYYPYSIDVAVSGAGSIRRAVSLRMTDWANRTSFDGVVVNLRNSSTDWRVVSRGVGNASNISAGAYNQTTGVVSLSVAHARSRDGRVEIRLAFYTGTTPTPTATGTPTPTTAATGTPTPTATGAPTPTQSPVVTPMPTLTPAPTEVPRPTGAPLPTEAPVASPTGTVQPTPAPLPYVGVTSQGVTGVTGVGVTNVSSDPQATQRAGEVRNMIQGLMGSTSRTLGSRGSTYGATARAAMTTYMGVTVNGYTSSIQVVPYNLIKGTGATMAVTVSAQRSANTAATKYEVFLVQPTYSATDAGAPRTMTGFEVVTPAGAYNTSTGTGVVPRTFSLSIPDQGTKDQNGTANTVWAEYYLVKVATHSGTVTATPTSRYRSSGGCSAFGYGPLALLLLAPLSLLKGRKN